MWPDFAPLATPCCGAKEILRVPGLLKKPIGAGTNPPTNRFHCRCTLRKRSGIMSILDGLLKQAVGAVDIQQIAERVGLPADKVESAVAALGAAHHEPTDTVQTASGQTGIEPGKLQEIMQHLGGEEALGKIASLLGQSGGGNPLGGLSSFLRK
jgi:hypothetical protein